MSGRSHRERLYATFADTDLTTDEKIRRALEIGSEYFDLPIGYLARIEGTTQEIVDSVGSHELLQPGETCPLEDAYCRKTVKMDRPLAVRDAVESSDIATRAVERFGLGTYIGAQVHVEGDLYGTVCFADETGRDESFSETGRLFLELIAEQVGKALERRKHERALRERNERLEREKQRFEAIAEASFDMLFRVGADGEFTYVSSAVERVLGYSPDDLVGVPFDEVVTDDSVDDAATAFARVLDGEPVEALELAFFDTEGETVAVEVNATPTRVNGDIVGVQGVGRDVTARKERERELWLKTRAMDEATIGISIADATQPDNPLVYVNRGLERLTGYDAEELLGQNSRLLQGEATSEETIQTLREHIDDERPVSVETINYRKDGTPFWNQVRISPIENEGGEVTQWVGFQTDITSRKRTEQLIQLLNRVLRHNLRNELNALLGYGGLLVEGAHNDDASVGRRIRRVSSRLVDLSEQVRDLETAARQERRPERLDPAAVIADAVDDGREAFPEATVDVTVRTDRDVCVGTEVETAVDELVENALVHNPAPDPWVGIEATDDGEWVEVTVADDGPGIEDIEARVIAKGEESALEHGSGLGLWLVNWIVTRYGGSFQIDTRSGEDGSVATVRLPAIDEDTPVSEVERGPTVLFR